MQGVQRFLRHPIIAGLAANIIWSFFLWLYKQHKAGALMSRYWFVFCAAAAAGYSIPWVAVWNSRSQPSRVKARPPSLVTFTKPVNPSNELQGRTFAVAGFEWGSSTEGQPSHRESIRASMVYTPLGSNDAPTYLDRAPWLRDDHAFVEATDNPLRAQLVLGDGSLSAFTITGAFSLQPVKLGSGRITTVVLRPNKDWLISVTLHAKTWRRKFVYKLTTTKGHSNLRLSKFRSWASMSGH
jgi:hypothetical protein